MSDVCSDNLHLRLAIIHFDTGSELALPHFQHLLYSLNERAPSAVINAKKVSVLSWMARCYVELSDPSCCDQVLAAIRAIRENSATSVTSSGAGPGTGTGTGTPNSLRSIYSSNQSQAHSVNYSVSLGRSVSLSQRSDRTDTLTDSSPRVGVGLRNDALESCLPKYCISSYDADLSELSARAQMSRGNHHAALECLLPALIGVEILMCNQCSGAREGLLELARLYSLRGECCCLWEYHCGVT